MASLSVVVMVAAAVMVTTGRGEDLQDSLKRQHLRETLLQGYDKQALPPTPAVVNISQFAIRDLEMHEGAHRLSLHAWISFSWMDNRLSWKAEDYGGLSKLSFSPRDVWLPDFSVYNAGDAEATLLTSKFRVIVFPSGQVLHVPSLDLHYSCVADLTYWPHDAHNCTLKIGSWVHDEYTVDIQIDEGLTANMDEVTTSPDGEMDTMEWELVSSTLKRESRRYECCPEPYVSLLAVLVLRREAPAYNWIIKTPAVCLILLSLVLFTLPPAAGEKIVFGGLCLVLNLMFLVFAHGTVRNAPSHTPLLVQLVALQLVLAAASVLVSSAVVRAARGPFACPPVPALYRFALTLAPALCLSSYLKQASGQGRLRTGTPRSDEVELDNEAESGRASGHGRLRAGIPRSDEVEFGSEAEGGRCGEQGVGSAQWLLFAAVLDRLALFLYLVLIVLLLISFSSVL